jgi:hypothetical protein
MNPEFYLNKWKDLKDSGLGENEIHHLCSRIALSFLDRYYYNDEFAASYIDILCEIATSDNGHVASSSLFGAIIEGLCDDFEELQTKAYNRVMSRIINFCRKIPQGESIDAKLNSFGFDSEEKIFQRIERLRHATIKRRDFSKAKKFIVLSRVTIGADVAVTSVIIQRLIQLYPNAEIVIIGDSKLKSLFGGNKKLKFRELAYSRRGGLVERILTWHDVLDIVTDEAKMFALGECILIDSDSRLSQLGVLPIVRDDDYLFFKSRGGSGDWAEKLSMAELVNKWADNVFGGGYFSYPTLWLPDLTMEKGRHIVNKLRNSHCKRLVFVNFGVGGNPRKRIDGEFETMMLLRLLEMDGTVIILDKGFGQDELERYEAIMEKLKKSGVHTHDVKFNSEHIPDVVNGTIIGISAEIGEAASLISASDLYIGYDSACQHIAAAAKLKTITIFAGTNNTKFVRRWRAFGLAKSDLIHVDTLGKTRFFDNSDIVNRVIEAIKE